MADRKVSQEIPEDMKTALIIENDIDDDFSCSSSSEGKPKTGPELYRALVENGFIGAWKDRTDIGDSLEYAHWLRKRASERRRGQ
ncbi:MAG: hypothetical protein M3Y58_06025 [Chloroflexota bacterium]|nr:hypothetical protein [Chloroflexota bacterium]